MPPITAGLMAYRIISHTVKVKVEVSSSLRTAKRAHMEAEVELPSFLPLSKYESGQFHAPVATRVPTSEAKIFCVLHIQSNTIIFHLVLQ